MIDLNIRQLTDDSHATVGFALCDFPSGRHGRVAVLSFVGQADNSEYPGSYYFMAGMIAAAVQRWRPDAVVLDLRGTAYEWGDEMHITLISAQLLPMTIVASEFNRKGSSSLIEIEIGESVGDWLFDSLEQAVIAVDKRLK